MVADEKAKGGSVPASIAAPTAARQDDEAMTKRR
jgi:hypothetical protein